MPHVDSYEVLTSLRQVLPDEGFLPVLALTGDTTTQARERALDAGANDFLTKPFDRRRVRPAGEEPPHDARALPDGSAPQPRAASRARRARRRGTGASPSSAISGAVASPMSSPTAHSEWCTNRSSTSLAGRSSAWRRWHDSTATRRGRRRRGSRRPPRSASPSSSISPRSRRRSGALDRLPDDVFLSLNSSPATVISGRLDECLRGVASDRIVLELTEHTRIDDYDVLGAALDELRRQGARVAVDDAGAGYAGLQQILRLRPDIVKLDLEFTRTIDADPVRRALATSLVTFGRDTGAVDHRRGHRDTRGVRHARAPRRVLGAGLLSRPARPAGRSRPGPAADIGTQERSIVERRRRGRRVISGERTASCPVLGFLGCSPRP